MGKLHAYIILSSIYKSVELSCLHRSIDRQAIKTFTFKTCYENDQGILNIPILHNNVIEDHLLLYYVVVYDYIVVSSQADDTTASPTAPVISSVGQSDRLPLLVGHAGAGVKREHSSETRRYWPENTIAAFKRAQQLGLPMVECDVTVTRDYASAVLHHNFTVKMIPDPDNTNGLALDHEPDGPVHQHTTDLIAHKSLTDIHNLLDQGGNFIQPPTSVLRHSNRSLTSLDPLPRTDGFEGQALPELTSVFDNVSPDLGFNLELKYPTETLFGVLDQWFDQHRYDKSSYVNVSDLAGPHTYFSRINKFCDKILDVVWSHAGPRKILFSSFNADICLVLKQKQQQFPVLFITRGGIPSKSSPTFSFIDRRHLTIESAISWAKVAGLDGIVTLGVEHFTKEPTHGLELAQSLKENQLICFVYGPGVSNLTFFDQAKQLGLSGVIIDNIEQVLEDYQSQRLEIEKLNNNVCKIEIEKPTEQVPS